MKTLTATFSLPSGAIAAAQASFASIPGGSQPISWSGEVEELRALLPATAKLWAEEWPETFERTMQTLGAALGLAVRLQEEGEWETTEL